MSDTVTREKVLDAEPAEAWDALTDPQRMASWLGEPLEVDLHPGGEFRVRLRGGEERAGWVEEADAPRRLSFWWGADGEESTRVELTLAPDAAGTRLTIVESRPLAALEHEVQRLTGGPQALALAR